MKFKNSRDGDEAENHVLPANLAEFEILSGVQESPVMMIRGATGCGKSTQVPKILLRGGIKRILVTQPRRIAATEVCKRIHSELMAEGVDCDVEYQIRHESVRLGNPNLRTGDAGAESSGKLIRVVTEGILLRYLEKDIRLSDFDAVILDEVHERSVGCDICLTLLTGSVKSRSQVGNGLKLVLMSATLGVDSSSMPWGSCSQRDKKRLNRLLGVSDIPVVEIPEFKGRKKLDIYYAERSFTRTEVLDAAAFKALELHKTCPAGSIVVFVSGSQEAKAVCRSIDMLATSPSGEKSHRASSSGDIDDEGVISDDDAISDDEAISGGPVPVRETGDFDDVQPTQHVQSSVNGNTNGTNTVAVEMKLEGSFALVGGRMERESKETEDVHSCESKRSRLNDSPNGTSVVVDHGRTKLPLSTRDASKSIFSGAALGQGQVVSYAVFSGQKEEIVAEALSDPRSPSTAGLDASRLVRKVIVATNVAETSLTIPNVRYIIDTGYCKRLEADTSSISSAVILREGLASRCSMDQRAGRAGRIGHGACYRLFPTHVLGHVADNEVPEISRSIPSVLERVFMTCKRFKLEPSDLVWPARISEEGLEKVKTMLTVNGLLGANGAVSQDLMRAADLPLPIRFGAMILRAGKWAKIHGDYDAVKGLVAVAVDFSTNRGNTRAPEPLDISKLSRGCDEDTYESLCSAYDRLQERLGDCEDDVARSVSIFEYVLLLRNSRFPLDLALSEWFKTYMQICRYLKISDPEAFRRVSESRLQAIRRAVASCLLDQLAFRNTDKEIKGKGLYVTALGLAKVSKQSGAYKERLPAVAFANALALDDHKETFDDPEQCDQSEIADEKNQRKIKLSNIALVDPSWIASWGRRFCPLFALKPAQVNLSGVRLSKDLFNVIYSPTGSVVDGPVSDVKANPDPLLAEFQ